MNDKPKFRHGQLVLVGGSTRRARVRGYDATSDAYLVGAALTSQNEDEGEWVASSDLRPYLVSAWSMRF